MAKSGDCYEAAFNALLDLHHSGDAEGWMLVHGEVTGSPDTKIAGQRYGHAWIEGPVWYGPHAVSYVRDYSNGRDIKLPRAIYYRAGKITDPTCYTFDDACAKALEHEHYGPWN